MGYTYKALGAALWACRQAVIYLEKFSTALGVTRSGSGTVAEQFPAGVRAVVFRIIIMRLILEGGDADTNGAVVGSVLVRKYWI